MAEVNREKLLFDCDYGYRTIVLILTFGWRRKENIEGKMQPPNGDMVKIKNGKR